jgi:hypothetical protein
MNADIPIKFAPLIHIEGNSVCADCISSHSDWVSLGFATFICLGIIDYKIILNKIMIL